MGFDEWGVDGWGGLIYEELDLRDGWRDEG